VHVTGIPVDPQLAESKERATVRRARNLHDGLLITFFGGGLTTARVRTAVMDLLESGVSGTLIVVAGRNAELEQALRDLTSSATLRLVVLGFIDYVDDLVVASDLVISKPGGLIVSEVLARGTPLLLVDPIPGQEDWNADYVSGAGAGVSLRLMDTLPFVVRRLLDTPERMRAMASSAAAIGRPRAAFDIVDRVLHDLAKGSFDSVAVERPALR
jgi:processive 1,2-diacylglycerol beta-glucosyltransferase